jgi:peptidoglycan hydrolase CwlO-like protein
MSWHVVQDKEFRMTFWAKILTLIILVLSIVFAAMSGVLFAKRQDYRAELVLTNKQRAEEKTKDNATIDRLESEKSDLATDLSAKQTELSTAKSQVDLLTNDMEEMRGKVEQLQGTLAKEQDNVTTLTQATNDLVSRNDVLGQENGRIRQENLALTENLANEQNTVNNLKKEVASLTEQRETLQAGLTDARETIQLNEEVFAELAKRNIEAQTVIAGLTAVPQIKARVMTVDPKTNLVVLNAGSEQGVRKNFEFTIFRDDKFVAKVIVFDTDKDMSAARIATRSPDIDIKQGDQAWTRLQ